MCFDLFSFLDLDSRVRSVVGAVFSGLFVLFLVVGGFRHGSLMVSGLRGFTGAAFLVIVLLIASLNILGLGPFTYIYSAHVFLGIRLGVPL